jgi:holo-[acyl-carrier protein] synthase
MRHPIETHLRKQVPTSVGLDVVRVAEVLAALDRFGERYVQRVYTPREAAYCLAGTADVTARRFAARFAAKEAAVKALAPSSRWTDWRTIEVRRRPSGACALVLHGEAAALAAQRGIERLALSMSHDGDLAVACVVALRTPTPTNAHPPEHRHG